MKKKKCHAIWLISENVNEVIEPMIRRKRQKKLCMGRARSPMWLTASRQTAQNSTVNRQKSLFFTVNRQKCRLILMVEKSQFTSNLPI